MRHHAAAARNFPPTGSPSRPLPLRVALAAALACLAALALSACGNTIQDQPITRAALEPLVLQNAYPVYWLGGQFQDLAITETAHDPGGAYTIHYGDCIQGGQYTCVTPLSIVTSPDNSFVPGGFLGRATVSLRGVRGALTQRGATIVIPTGAVVVSIFAKTAVLALAAAQTMVPINRLGVPGQPLPPRQPDTGFASEPLPSQEPKTVRIPGVRQTAAVRLKATHELRSSSGSPSTGARRRP
jgi:hypothetical protein